MAPIIVKIRRLYKLAFRPINSLAKNIYGEWSRFKAHSRHPAWLSIRRHIFREFLVDTKTGTVSLIVPIHNVERYLATALNSLRSQTYPHIEVILVDDASTDGSLAIAKHYVDVDDRFSLIQHHEAQGPGAARNAGLELARGKYLMFVDADDLLPVTGIYNMLKSLKISGSDFVVGGVHRLRGRERWPLPWSQQVHGHTRRALKLEDFPEALLNPFCWGKLFVREYFDLVIGNIPEGVFYEDQVPAALAYSHARGFDVLSTVTYFWRIREEGTSITQNRDTLKSLEDRTEAIKGVKEILEQYASKQVQQYWLKDLLFAALLPFFEARHRASEEYRSRLQDLTAGLLQELGDESLLEVPAERLDLVRSVVSGV